jgi:VWFA-related protein
MTALPVLGQTPDPHSTLLDSVPTIRAEAKLVTVDVTVSDKNGQPVHGLKPGDFVLMEGNQQQSIRSFEENTHQTARSMGPVLPPMPPGTFSDYTSVPPGGALNVLLLDSLNTSIADQAYVRYQLQQYVKKAKPGTRIAIFGLAQKLFMLQGFDSDPQVLKNAVEHKLTARGSSLLDDAQGSGSLPGSASDSASAVAQQDPSNMALASVSSNIQQFEADQRAFALQLRIDYTLDAFNSLAHYLSAFPGRKNVIWFSGSFPINILPDPTAEKDSRNLVLNNEQFRETASLLSQAQVAVYPVDARGLTADPTFAASARRSDSSGKASAEFYQAHIDEHGTMNQLAEDTGGKASFNTNDLATAVQNAIESGSNYYTLTYEPPAHDTHGGYRAIHLALNGRLQAAGYTLAYRHGYFVDDPAHLSKDLIASRARIDDAPSPGAMSRYVQLAMAHGAPTPEDILFKVRVLPIDVRPEEQLAPNNLPNSVKPLKPPFRRFAIDIAAVPDAFQLTRTDDGRRIGAMEFSVLLYNSDGMLMNATGRTVPLSLTPEAYRQFLSGVNSHFEISVPVKALDSFLRIGVHDVPSNRMGVVEIPVVSVAHLTPLAQRLPQH